MTLCRNLITALVLACTAGLGWSRHAVTPAPPGSATIYRDVYGAPHIYAEREEDGYWGLGYSTAEDHLEGVLLRYLGLRGELASAFGKGPVAEQTGLLPLRFRVVQSPIPSPLISRR